MLSLTISRVFKTLDIVRLSILVVDVGFAVFENGEFQSRTRQDLSGLGLVGTEWLNVTKLSIFKSYVGSTGKL